MNLNVYFISNVYLHMNMCCISVYRWLIMTANMHIYTRMNMHLISKYIFSCGYMFISYLCKWDINTAGQLGCLNYIYIHVYMCRYIHVYTHVYTHECMFHL